MNNGKFERFNVDEVRKLADKVIEILGVNGDFLQNLGEELEYAALKNSNGDTGMNSDYVLTYTENYIKKATETVNNALDELPVEISLYDCDGAGVEFQFETLKNNIKLSLETNVDEMTNLINKCIQEGVDNIHIVSFEVADNMARVGRGA